MSEAIIGALSGLSALMMAVAWRLRAKNSHKNNPGSHFTPGDGGSMSNFMNRYDLGEMERRITDAIKETSTQSVAALLEIKGSLTRIEGKLHVHDPHS